MADKQKLKGRRLRLFFGLMHVLDRLGLGPTADRIAAQPMAVRKANRAAAWTTLPLPADVRMVRGSIAGRSGPIAIKTYVPPQPDPRCPRVLFMHGGGWVAGGLDTLDHLCASVCRQAQCTIVSVDYRLAPETVFPGALEDCYDALKWLASDAASGPLPPAGIVVMGESAGGNLAAALCVLAARGGEVDIRHQILIYPCVDASLQSPSMANGQPGLNRQGIARLLELYRGAAPVTDPLVSPMHADNHAMLPPALIITADVDPLRDDGARYADKLRRAGVEVTYTNYEGMPHGFFFMPAICSAAADGIAQISAQIVALGQAARANPE